jgi:hypothetical protein
MARANRGIYTVKALRHGLIHGEEEEGCSRKGVVGTPADGQVVLSHPARANRFEQGPLGTKAESFDAYCGAFPDDQTEIAMLSVLIPKVKQGRCDVIWLSKVRARSFLPPARADLCLQNQAAARYSS